MQITTFGTYPVTLGSLIAFLVLVAVVVLVIVGMMSVRDGLLLGGLAIARLT